MKVGRKKEVFLSELLKTVRVLTARKRQITLV